MTPHRGSTWHRAGLAFAAVVSIIGLPACSSVGAASGAAAGLAAGAGSANPAVAVGVAIAVKATVDEVVKNVQRGITHDEQNRIAEVVGETDVGQRRQWEVHHTLRYGDSQGEVMVIAATTNALTTCKQAVFRLTEKEGGAPSQPFATTICQGAQGWQWAVAEPAAARWGALQ